MKKLISKINEKHVDNNGILQIKVIDGAHIDLDSLKDDHKGDAILTHGKKTLALFDARSFFTITPEAYKYLKNGIIDKSRIATAVVTDRLGVKILVNFFIQFKNLKSPMKMFSSEKEAIEWLLQFKREA